MKKIGLIVGLSFLAGAVFFALTFGFLQKSADESPRLSPVVAQAQSAPQQGGPNLVILVKKVKPAVVKVLSESVAQRRSPFGDEFFNAPSRPEKVTGVGSGFFISADGYIITNNHVVEDAVKVKVITSTDQEYSARIIGKDPKTDLALLKVKGDNFPFVTLGDSNSVEVGEWVLAIGNPFYQDLSVTAGIISAKGRQLGAAQYEDFLQTDAAINRGNSGGPLINMEGKVIGINSAIIAPAGGNVGIGFAIPANMANKVVRDLQAKGRVVRGWFGISIRTLTEEEAKDFDIPMSGALITDITGDSPASRAGLRRNDMIVEINGQRIKTDTDLKRIMADSSPGDIMDLTVYRGSEKLKMKIKVAESPDSTYRVSGTGEENTSLDLGMVLVNNNRNLAREYDLRTAKGILVREVKRGSAAAQSDIKTGDVIFGINRYEINTVNEFRDILAKKAPGSSVFLYINRYGDEFIIKFQLPEE